MKKILILLIYIFINQSFCQEVSSVKPAFEILTKYNKVRDLTLTPLADEAYATIQSTIDNLSVIVCMKLINNKWSEPKIVTFSGKYKDLEPFVTPNGLRLYFSSNRPIDTTSTKVKDYDIWYVKRKNKDDKWSKPIILNNNLINTMYDEFYPSLANNNNLYFTRNSPQTKGKDDVFFSKWTKGVYDKPLSLSDSINTEGYEFNSYIAPDETFLIFSGYNRVDSFGSGDLYISFKNPNGQWEKAMNLGEGINSDKMDYCPYVDSLNQILYFTSTRYKRLKKEFHSMKELEKELNQYQNGLSRIYKTSFFKIRNNLQNK
jgi:hypothetical protein